jgi:hypothetical protein
VLEHTDVSTVKYLHRWPLGTAYPAIVSDVDAIMKTLPDEADQLMLAIDQTGVGAPVVDLFRQAPHDYSLRAVHITGGSAVSHDGGITYVPKRDLVGAVAVALQKRALKVDPGLKHADTLRDELLNFKVTFTASGHDSYGAGADWRSGNHDDLVLGLAIALWSATHRRMVHITVLN